MTVKEIPASRTIGKLRFSLVDIVGNRINQDNNSQIYSFFNEVVDYLSLGVPLDRNRGYEIPDKGIIKKLGNGIYQATPFDSDPNTLSTYTLNILVDNVSRDIASDFQKGRPVVYN